MGLLRTNRDRFFDGVGVPPGMLEPGLRVMVPVNTVNAYVNGGPSTVAMAVAVGPADRDGVWWFQVYNVPGLPPLPQMYPIEQLLGVPTHGLVMPGLEEPAGSDS